MILDSGDAETRLISRRSRLLEIVESSTKSHLSMLRGEVWSRLTRSIRIRNTGVHCRSIRSLMSHLADLIVLLIIAVDTAPFHNTPC